MCPSGRERGRTRSGLRGDDSLHAVGRRGDGTRPSIGLALLYLAMVVVALGLAALL